MCFLHDQIRHRRARKTNDETGFISRIGFEISFYHGPSLASILSFLFFSNIIYLKNSLIENFERIEY